MINRIIILMLVISTMIMVCGCSKPQPTTSEVNKFFNAVRECDLEIIKEMLDKYPAESLVNEQDKMGWTPLHYAAAFNYRNVAMMLVENGANINLKNNSGQTPLHIASKMSCISVANYLLDNSALVNSKNNVGLTPLDTAMMMKHDTMSEILVKSGARVRDVNKIRLLISQNAKRRLGAREAFASLPIEGSN